MKSTRTFIIVAVLIVAVLIYKSVPPAISDCLQDNAKSFFLWFIDDIEHALVTISVVFPLVNLFVTRNLKKVDLRHDYLKSIHEKRLESYPKLHILTDELGSISRDYIIDKKDIAKYLKSFADWDAKYAIFAGINTTQQLGNLRRLLEDWKNKGISIHDKKRCQELLTLLECLEHSLKCELKVLLTSDLEGEPIPNDTEYIESIRKKKNKKALPFLSKLFKFK